MSNHPYFTMRRLEKEFNRFNADNNNFDIKNLSITKTRETEGWGDKEISDVVKFTFNFKKQYDFFEFPNLPRELNEIIHGFNHHYASLSVIVVYPIDYPFRHTFWYFDNLVTNLDLRVIEFYKYKLDLHIESIRPHLWSSSAMTMEKDVLSFLETINYFDDLINS